jgi:hypothetical protein
MEHRSGIPERRNSIRLETICEAAYTRIDKERNPAPYTPCKAINLSLGGVRLRSSFPVTPGEKLDVIMTLRNKSIKFRGIVIHVNLCEDQDFELGVSIQEMDKQDRIGLKKFIYYFNPPSKKNR